MFDNNGFSKPHDSLGNGGTGLSPAKIQIAQSFGSWIRHRGDLWWNGWGRDPALAWSRCRATRELLADLAGVDRWRGLCAAGLDLRDRTGNHAAPGRRILR